MKNQISSRSLRAGREILIFLLIHRHFAERSQPFPSAGLNFGSQRPDIFGIVLLVLAVFESLDADLDIPAQGLKLPLPEQKLLLKEAQSIAHYLPRAGVAAARHLVGDELFEILGQRNF